MKNTSSSSSSEMSRASSSSSSWKKKMTSSTRLGRYIKQQQGRLYIIKRCVVILLCSRD
ncbi:Small polypeptide DEVIL 1 [Linum perenne]